MSFLNAIYFIFVPVRNPRAGVWNSLSSFEVEIIPSSLHLHSGAPVLVALKPDDTQPASYDAQNKVSKGH